MHLKHVLLMHLIKKSQSGQQIDKIKTNIERDTKHKKLKSEHYELQQKHWK